LRIKIYPKITDKCIQEQTMVGRDSNGSFYLLDVEHITPFDYKSKEELEVVSWNNIDFDKEEEIRKKAEEFFNSITFSQKKKP